MMAGYPLGLPYVPCSHWLRFPPLLLGVAILFAAYTGMLFYGMRQKMFYMDLLRELLKRPPVEVEQPVVTRARLNAPGPLLYDGRSRRLPAIETFMNSAHGLGLRDRSHEK